MHRMCKENLINENAETRVVILSTCETQVYHVVRKWMAYTFDESPRRHTGPSPLKGLMN